MGSIVRHNRTATATIASGQTKSAPVDLTELAFGGLALPAEFDGSAITFEGCDTQDGTYLPVYDADNAAVGIPAVAASRAYPIPPECFAFNFIKIVAGTAQTGNTSIIVTGKA